MNSIQLTQEQKDKLLEMSNELFKDIENFKYVSMCDQQQRHGIHCSEESKQFVSISIQDGFIFPICCIHWFEFCMIHLLDKLSEDDYIYQEVKNHEPEVNYLDGTIATGLQLRLINKKMHPVDYLYRKFCGI